MFSELWTCARDQAADSLQAIVAAGFFSAVPALILFLFLLVHSARSLSPFVEIDFRDVQRRVLKSKRQAIHPISVFYLCLLFWDIIIGLGWIVSVRWILRGQIETGAYCVTQGIISVLK